MASALKRLGRKLGGIHDERAQGIVEFAFVATALMFLFLGTIDFSRFMYYDTAITNAARVGAETAGNYCNVPGCGVQNSPTTDDSVMQSTYCEATASQVSLGASAISLQPAVDCTPCTTTTCDPCSSTSPYLGACTPCTKDICINPTGTRTKGSTVTVYVGYLFKPYAFYIAPFFNDTTCFPSGSAGENEHTLCASAVGRVAVR